MPSRQGLKPFNERGELPLRGEGQEQLLGAVSC